jgi:transcriptional regulator with XRE-family HTH domain
VAFVLAPTHEVLETLGHRVRAQRLAQGLPQRELAQMAGLSLGALRKLEGTGQSSLDTLVRTAQALGLVQELDDLFVLQRQSIAQMEQAHAAQQRQRAPRRKGTTP